MTLRPGKRAAASPEMARLLEQMRARSGSDHVRVNPIIVTSQLEARAHRARFRATVVILVLNVVGTIALLVACYRLSRSFSPIPKMSHAALWYFSLLFCLAAYRLPSLMVRLRQCATAWDLNATARACTGWFETEGLEQFRKSHKSALSALEQASEHGSPLIVYLRSFDAESAPIYTDGHLDVQVQSVSPELAVEERIWEVMHPLAPMVALAHPTGLILARRPIPRLAVSDEAWLGVVRTLVESADIIIVELLTLGGGVSAEIDLIRGVRKQGTCVLVVMDIDPYRDAPYETVLRHNRKWSSSESLASLNDFPRKVLASEVIHNGVLNLPAFSTLLESLRTGA